MMIINIIYHEPLYQDAIRLVHLKGYPQHPRELDLCTDALRVMQHEIILTVYLGLQKCLQNVSACPPNSPPHLQTQEAQAKVHNF